MNNLLVGQSGGPTAVINSSLAGVVKNGLVSSEIGKVFGTVNGIEGVINDNIISMKKFVDDSLIDLLKQTPSSYLGSCRKKLPEIEQDEEFYKKVFETFKKYEIGYFFYIGGNDSMDTVNKLSKYADSIDYEIKIVGVPKTIDNDLALTDHTPGYGSASKFIANSLRQVSLDAEVYKINSVTLVEIMGRNAGWLTASAALARDNHFVGADIMCLPETNFDMDKFLAKVESVSNEKGNVVVALSEGVKDKDGKYICEYISKQATRNDQFNHAVLGGAGRAIENFIIDSLGYKTRTVELSTMQRCYSQSASLTDINEAYQVGFEGVELAKQGMSGIMPGFKRLAKDKYQIEIVPFKTSEVANLEKTMPLSMITEDGMYITEEYLDYARPLIEGEPELKYDNGLLKFVLR